MPRHSPLLGLSLGAPFPSYLELKFPLSCFLLLALAAIGHAATNLSPTPAPLPLTAKEIAQGYRDTTILAKPIAAHRATIDDEENRDGVRVRQKFSRFGDLRVIELASTDNPRAAIARLRATGRYEYVEPDYVRSVQTEPNDPRYIDGSLWAFKNTGQSGGTAGADISAAAAWTIVHDAANVVVAVVDTGLNLNHQDIAANLWTNPSPTAGDLHGANFVNGAGQMVSGDPSDDDGHGTHVAGIIGAVGNNSIGVTGVAWRVQIMPLKALSAIGSGSASDIDAAISYAIGHGASVINASYGSLGSIGYLQSDMTVLTAARNAGLIFVAAAGNDTTNLDISRAYPANYPLDNILAVGASTRTDDPASFSNYGAAVDLFAPGQEILSLDYASNTGTVYKDGTSMAAPEVAGVLALLRAAFPADNYHQTINRLLCGVDHPANFAGKADTSGRLNAYGALTTTSTRPFNDDFGARPHFTSDFLTIRASNVGATAESGEPAHAGFTPTATLWWEWTAQTGGPVTIDTTGSGYDTVLAVYAGTSVGNLTPIVSNDNNGGSATSLVQFTAQPGATYEIAVDGKNGATGLTLLNVATPPLNDAFATPTVLNGQSSHSIGLNAHCTRESGEPRILGLSGGNSVWYQWTARSSGRYQVSASSNDFDPILAVYTGNSLGALTLVAANDNASSSNGQTGALCSINAIAGTTYHITVDTKTAGATGQFTLVLVDSVWQAAATKSITGSPAVAADGSVYVGSTDDSLYAFAADGTLKWSAKTGGTIDTCSPAVGGDGTVYVGSFDGSLYAYTSSGSLRWKHMFSATTPAGCSPAIGPDGTIYVRVSDGYLHALGASTGTELWKANVNTVSTSFYGNPVVAHDGTVYQGSDETDHTLYAFTPSGAAKWKFTTDSGVYGAPAIDGSGNLYVATLTGGVYSITAAGSQRWHVNSGGNISSSLALSADGGTLYYGGYDHLLYARDTATGAARWTYALGGEVRASSPAIDGNGAIYIGCYDDKLYAVNPDGSLNRTYDTGDIIRSSPAIAGTRLYIGSNDQMLYAFDVAAGSAGGSWPQYRNTATRIGLAVAPAVTITAQPQSQVAVIGYPLTIGVTATGPSALGYQWYKDGVAIAGATSASYTVSSTTAATAGTYTVTITSGQLAATSSAATVAVEQPNPGRLVNLSARTTAGTGDQTLIVGFVVSGSTPKPLLVRGVGPTLSALGVSDPVSDPQLRLINKAGTVIVQNDNWSDPALPDKSSSVGAFALPAGSTDAAALATVGADNYFLDVTNASGAVGTALAEIYDLDPTPTSSDSRLTNVSARSFVGTDAHLLIAGFSISGNVPKTVLIRGVGPGLVKLGVASTDALADPKLELYRHNVLYTSNDNWSGDSATTAVFDQVGAFHLDGGSTDSVLVLTLPPDTYTAQVSGVNNTTGIGLVEVYEVP